MLKSKLASLFADPYGAPAIVRRLLTEEGVKHWRGYAVSFLLMSIAAGCTSISASLIGQLVNQAYVPRDFAGIVARGVFTCVPTAVRAAHSSGNVQMRRATQETIRAIRTVKAFTLEEAMLERLDRAIDVVERESNRMARVANRLNPLMESLGGIAVAIAMVYSGYRVVITGAT